MRFISWNSFKLCLCDLSLLILKRLMNVRNYVLQLCRITLKILFKVINIKNYLWLMESHSTLEDGLLESQRIDWPLLCQVPGVVPLPRSYEGLRLE